ADVGKGVHVLAIFDPSADLEVVDHRLTACGVGPPRFVGGQPITSTMRLPDILQVIQKRFGEGESGLVVLPHAQAEAGIFDRDRIAEWLQAEEFTNPQLLCVEVPKPVSEMSAAWQKLFRAGEDCDPEWR